MDHKERCEVYYGLVDAVLNAMRYPKSVLNEGGLRDDLLSIGFESLVVASTRYDPERGLKFQTYASSIIRGNIQKHMTKIRKEKARCVSIGKLEESYINSQMENLEGPSVEEYDWALVDSLAPVKEVDRSLYYEHIIGDRSIREICEEYDISVKAGRKRVGRLKNKLKEILNEN